MTGNLSELKALTPDKIAGMTSFELAYRLSRSNDMLIYGETHHDFHENGFAQAAGIAGVRAAHPKARIAVLFELPPDDHHDAVGCDVQEGIYHYMKTGNAEDLHLRGQQAALVQAARQNGAEFFCIDSKKDRTHMEEKRAKLLKAYEKVTELTTRVQFNEIENMGVSIAEEQGAPAEEIKARRKRLQEEAETLNAERWAIVTECDKLLPEYNKAAIEDRNTLMQQRAVSIMDGSNKESFYKGHIPAGGFDKVILINGAGHLNTAHDMDDHIAKALAKKGKKAATIALVGRGKQDDSVEIPPRKHGPLAEDEHDWANVALNYHSQAHAEGRSIAYQSECARRESELLSERQEPSISYFTDLMKMQSQLMQVYSEELLERQKIAQELGGEGKWSGEQRNGPRDHTAPRPRGPHKRGG